MSTFPTRPRVLHIAQRFKGGVGSFLEEIAPFQSSYFGGSNVRFVVPATADVSAGCIDPAQLIPFASDERTPTALWDFVNIARRALQLEQPDIVHLHSSYAGALLRPLLAPKRGRCAVVYCPHGWSFGMEISRPKKRVYSGIERFLASVSDAIIVNSEDEQALARRFGVPLEKVVVVKNGISWTPRPQRQRRSGPMRLGFVGRHDRQKGLDLLLDVLRHHQFPNLQFEIVGESSVPGATPRQSAELAGVSFHGWLSRPAIMEFLSTLDALIMPSRWDAAPIIATEAMRAGVPVIGSNRGGLPEILEDGVGGHVFDLDDPQSLVGVLQSLRRDKLEQLASGARARWEREYVSDRMNERTIEVYHRVLNRLGDVTDSRDRSRQRDSVEERLPQLCS